MTTRKTRGVGKLPDVWRERIQVGVMLDRMLKHFNGEVEMTRTQLEAGKIILAKIVPDLARQELTGLDGNAIEHKVTSSTDDEILQRFKQQEPKK